ncbi:hypothetical protein [Alcaligenes endophyticus]|uniref:Outer membrane protein beta-barrel domain-containing protein n=1 Tax=Alcaligenes endophyticus TaxID=1929088 RepID=A0ABT8EJX3_9BURK|nr:hypothetical protein [Alcaligenes endophyticus]MCX5591889.1 hypothetical protein [Alcaligenes endophyticus]MDN4121578.1 hypothetical protein [Alcaligenes endophyticus]
MKLSLRILALGAALSCAAAGAQAQSIYGKAGFLGVGVGYAHSLSPNLTLRGDFTTIGSYSRNGSSTDFDYRGKLHNDVGTAYLDYFPFDNGFRLTAGLGVRNTKIKAHARPSSTGTINIGNAKDIPFDGNDSANAEAKFPSVAPYLGLGWGHNIGPNRRAGWGFIADAGVYFGKPKVSLNVNQDLRNKITAAGFNADEEVQRQKNDFEDDAHKLRVFPALFIGVSYTF